MTETYKGHDIEVHRIHGAVEAFIEGDEFVFVQLPSFESEEDALEAAREAIDVRLDRSGRSTGTEMALNTSPFSAAEHSEANKTLMYSEVRCE